MILTNHDDIAKQINSAVFPGLQGGPLMHVIAAKAVAFGEALGAEFKQYSQSVLDNANALSNTLIDGGLDLVSGGTDTHLMLVDLRSIELSGKDAEGALGKIGITCNKNSVPYDTASPMITSGIRLGTPAVTTRGFDSDDLQQVGHLILECLYEHANHGGVLSQSKQLELSQHVLDLTKRYPIYH